MVSMCCEDCKAEKLKSNVLNKIILNEHCKNISEYLGCDDCIKMKAIINDPIYKTLDPEQQQIYKVIKLLPFPVDIGDFKAVLKYTGKEYLTKHINDMNIINFKKVQDLYNNLYVKKYYEKKYYCDDFDIRHFNPERILFDIIFCFMKMSVHQCSLKHVINIDEDDILDISGADGYGYGFFEV